MKTKIKIVSKTLMFFTILALSSSFFIASNLLNGPSRIVSNPDPSLNSFNAINVASKSQAPNSEIKILSTNLSAAIPTKNTSTSSKNISKTTLSNIIEESNYEYAGQSDGTLTLAPGESQNLWINLKNTGDTSWEKSTFHLGTYRSQDRSSVFANTSWLSANRIGIDQDIVDPGYIAHFDFTITAPATSGVYYEYFRPVIDGNGWMNDVGIYWKITVKNPNEDESTLPIYNKIGAKKILISLSQQNLKCYEGTDIVCDFPISSGLPSLPTPIGNFKIENKRTTAYSAPYDLYMNWWMAFTPNEAYGIHELPYWKYSWGTVTEGANHLGTKVSHGCVRLGIGPAKQVYDWAPVGTPVEIVN